MAAGRTGYFVITPNEAAKVSLDELGKVVRTHGTFNHYLATLNRKYRFSQKARFA